MILLGIETSCDETAVCILEAQGGLKKPSFKVLGNGLYSQVKIHEEYGGVYPMMAKREHALNLVPLFKKALKDAKMLGKPLKNNRAEAAMEKKIREILEREPGLAEQFLAFAPTIVKPKIDAIAVTFGPGLEPALWVGVNFAKAVGVFWDIPIIPTNHMEGHIASVLLQSPARNSKLKTQNSLKFPLLALLISGGHTELVWAKEWGKYKIIGETRDDAVGEAFDKVARMLGLPYPGGPQITKLADEDRKRHKVSAWKFPRPMIASDDLDFSFSGLKTSILYTIKKMPEVTLQDKRGIAREFEDAVIDVLIAKTEKALEKHGAKSLIIGGGVSINENIRHAFTVLTEKMSDIDLYLPSPNLSTDNAIMIAMAGFIEASKRKGKMPRGLTFRAQGNLRL